MIRFPPRLTREHPMDQQDIYRAAERPPDNDRRRTVFRTLSVLAAVGVAAALLVAAVPALRSLLPEPRTNSAAYPTQSAPDGISATSSERAAPTDPFAGTAARAYPKGAAGITLPPAKAVKGFTAAEVGASLKKVRAAMIAGRLDHEMLVEHKPAKFLALLAPTDRKSVAKWFKTNDFSTVATWIDPAVKLDPQEEPRVSGRITYASLVVDDIRTLRVTTNFVYVYAFRGWDRPIAAVHDEIQWEFTHPDDVYPADRGMWLGETQSYMAMMDCLAAERDLLAPGSIVDAPEVDPSDTSDPDDWLKPDYKLDIGDDCAPASAKPSS